MDPGPLKSDKRTPSRCNAFVPLYYTYDTGIYLYYKYTGTTHFDEIGQDITTTVVTVNAGEDVHDYISSLKPLWEKSPD